MLEKYSEGGFELNEPDYVIDGLEFIGTCGSHPEQYSVVLRASDGERYQVGYVRLRGGMLYAIYPDIMANTAYVFYEYHFEDSIGCFESEEQRMYHLGIIANKINKFLDGVSYGYS